MQTTPLLSAYSDAASASPFLDDDDATRVVLVGGHDERILVRCGVWRGWC